MSSAFFNFSGMGFCAAGIKVLVTTTTGGRRFFRFWVGVVCEVLADDGIYLDSRWISAIIQRADPPPLVSIVVRGEWMIRL